MSDDQNRRRWSGGRVEPRFERSDSGDWRRIEQRPRRASWRTSAPGLTLGSLWIPLILSLAMAGWLLHNFRPNARPGSDTTEQASAERVDTPAMSQTANRAAAPVSRQPAVVTERGVRYYAPSVEEQRPAPGGKTNLERYDEALAWMNESRRVQRQIDGSGRYRVDGSGNVVSAGGAGNAELCRRLQDERDRLHARMRQPYGHQEGELFRARLNRNFRAWCDHDCGSC